MIIEDVRSVTPIAGPADRDLVVVCCSSREDDREAQPVTAQEKLKASSCASGFYVEKVPPNSCGEHITENDSAADNNNLANRDCDDGDDDGNDVDDDKEHNNANKHLDKDTLNIIGNEHLDEGGSSNNNNNNNNVGIQVDDDDSDNDNDNDDVPSSIGPVRMVAEGHIVELDRVYAESPSNGTASAGAAGSLNTTTTGTWTSKHRRRTANIPDETKFNSTVHCVGGGRQTDGVYYCSLCDYQGRIYTTIRDHFYRRHVATPAALTCTFCSKVFLRTERLRDHVRSRHTGEKPYRCRLCDKTYASAAARSMHEKACHQS